MDVTDLLDVDRFEVSDKLVKGPGCAQVSSGVGVAIALQNVRYKCLRLLAGLFNPGEGLLTDLFKCVFRQQRIA